jgi:hypothetical protein
LLHVKSVIDIPVRILKTGTLNNARNRTVVETAHALKTYSTTKKIKQVTLFNQWYHCKHHKKIHLKEIANDTTIMVRREVHNR